MTAYERRKENSKAIASVQFKPQYPTEVAREKKKTKPVWTTIDQRKEEELWDE